MGADGPCPAPPPVPAGLGAARSRLTSAMSFSPVAPVGGGAPGRPSRRPPLTWRGWCVPAWAAACGRPDGSVNKSRLRPRRRRERGAARPASPTARHPPAPPPHPRRGRQRGRGGLAGQRARGPPPGRSPVILAVETAEPHGVKPGAELHLGCIPGWRKGQDRGASC